MHIYYIYIFDQSLYIYNHDQNKKIAKKTKTLN